MNKDKYLEKGGFMPKKISIVIEDDLVDIIQKDSLTNKISVGEAIRRKLVDAYYSNQKQEEKIVKKYDEFEVKVEKKIEEEFSKIKSMLLRSNLYEITNLHLIKVLIKDIIGKDLNNEEQKKLIQKYLSAAKSLTLYHEVDSINTQERFESNVSEEYLKR